MIEIEMCSHKLLFKLLKKQEWYEEFRCEYKSCPIRKEDELPLKKYLNTTSPDEWITCAFSWSKSKSGQLFWADKSYEFNMELKQTCQKKQKKIIKLIKKQEWFKEFKKEIEKAYGKGHLRYHFKTTPVYSYITNSFTWETTEKGFCYWSKVQDKYDKLLKKKGLA